MQCFHAGYRSAFVLLATVVAVSIAQTGVSVESAETSPAMVSSTVVISQFQVAGGTAADEFVELHNVSGSPVDLNGYRVVYRSAAGSTDVAVTNWTTSTVIPAGGYYLIAHATGYDEVVTADVMFTGGGTGTFAAAGGGLALRQGIANTGTIIDSVGYGTATNAFVESSVATAPAANAAQARTTAGCTDTDNNTNDFAVVNPSAPRNSSTTAVLCTVTAGEVNLSGQVRTADGSGIVGAVVEVTDPAGTRRLARTSPFGYFTVEGLSAGEIYVVTARHRSFRFAPRIVNMDDSVLDLAIVAEP